MCKINIHFQKWPKYYINIFGWEISSHTTLTNIETLCGSTRVCYILYETYNNGPVSFQRSVLHKVSYKPIAWLCSYMAVYIWGISIVILSDRSHLFCPRNFYCTTFVASQVPRRLGCIFPSLAAPAAPAHTSSRHNHSFPSVYYRQETVSILVWSHYWSFFSSVL